MGRRKSKKGEMSMFHQGCKSLSLMRGDEEVDYTRKTRNQGKRLVEEGISNLNGLFMKSLRGK